MSTPNEQFDESSSLTANEIFQLNNNQLKGLSDLFDFVSTEIKKLKTEIKDQLSQQDEQKNNPSYEKQNRLKRLVEIKDEIHSIIKLSISQTFTPLSDEQMQFIRLDGILQYITLAQKDMKNLQQNIFTYETSFNETSSPTQDYSSMEYENNKMQLKRYENVLTLFENIITPFYYSLTEPEKLIYHDLLVINENNELLLDDTLFAVELVKGYIRQADLLFRHREELLQIMSNPTSDDKRLDILLDTFKQFDKQLDRNQSYLELIQDAIPIIAGTYLSENDLAIAKTQQPLLAYVDAFNKMSTDIATLTSNYANHIYLANAKFGEYGNRNEVADLASIQYLNRIKEAVERRLVIVHLIKSCVNLDKNHLNDLQTDTQSQLNNLIREKQKIKVQLEVLQSPKQHMHTTHSQSKLMQKLQALEQQEKSLTVQSKILHQYLSLNSLEEVNKFSANEARSQKENVNPQQTEKPASRKSFPG